MNRTTRALALLILGTVDGCHQSSAQHGACDRIEGRWRGDSVETDGGQDPSAIAVVQDVMHDEQWRIRRVLPDAFQRERVGPQGGHPVAEAMYVRENTNAQCVVELRDPRGGPSHLWTLTPRGDGRLGAISEGGWYTLVMRPGR